MPVKIYATSPLLPPAVTSLCSLRSYSLEQPRAVTWGLRILDKERAQRCRSEWYVHTDLCNTRTHARTHARANASTHARTHTRAHTHTPGYTRSPSVSGTHLRRVCVCVRARVRARALLAAPHPARTRKRPSPATVPKERGREGVRLCVRSRHSSRDSHVTRHVTVT